MVRSAIALGASCPSETDIIAAKSTVATSALHGYPVILRSATITLTHAAVSTSVQTMAAAPNGTKLNGANSAKAYGGSGAGSVTCPTACHRIDDACSASQL